MLIEPKRLFKIHLSVIAGIVVANAGLAIMDALGHSGLLGLARLLRVEEEANLPSFFSSLALLSCALVAFANRSRLGDHAPDSSAWSVLATFFAFLALDEAAMLHELANQLNHQLELTSVLPYLGVFVYLPVVIGLAALLLPFWLRQDRHLRVMLATGAAIYVAAAIGLELAENALITAGWHYSDLPLRIAVTLEESGEMVGVAVFLYTFLTRFSALGGGQLLDLTVPRVPERAVTEPAC